MQFLRDEIGFKVVRITGPSHNLLRLVFRTDGSEPEVKRLQPVGSEDELATPKVVRAVLAGVVSANEDFSTHYEVAEIAFVGSDSPPEDIYAILAYQIIERLETGGEFVFAPIR